jgi:LysM repeat protein
LKRKLLFIILGILVLLLLLIVGAAFLLNSRSAQTSVEIPPGGSTIHVGLTAPQGNPDWPLNSYIPLTVTAEGSQPLATIDLYVNGVLYESRQVLGRVTANTRSETWRWQPGTEGDFILVAYATDALGATGISQPVKIHAVSAAGNTSPITPQAGDTLPSIAEAQGIKVEDLAALNPGLPPSGSIPTDEPVFIPQADPPLTNLNIIPGIIQPTNEPTPTPPADPSQFSEQLQTLGFPPQDSQGDNQAPIELPDAVETPTPEPAGSLSPISSLVKSLPDLIKGVSANQPDYPPQVPKIKVDFKGCDVTVQLLNAVVYIDPHDPAAVNMLEDGFYLYRSRDGGPFERIADWDPIVELTDTYKDLYKYGYKETAQYGELTYMIAAYNSLGEVPSTPAAVPLDPVTCKKSSMFPTINTSVTLDDGNLVLPFSMDLAYFYIQADPGNGKLTQGWRVPEGDRTFLPNSGKELNLYDYLATVLDKLQAPDLDLRLEVWGWWGGKLTHAGNFKISLHRSVLLICSVEGEGACTKNGAPWTAELTLNDAKPLKEQVYEVKWLTTGLSPVKDVCMELAAGPYPNEDYWQVNLPIRAYCMDAKSNVGTFLLQLGPLLFPDEPKSVKGWGVGSHLMEYESNWFQFDYGNGKPFTLYMRVYPRHETSGFNRYANILPIHYKTSAVPSTLPPLASTYDSMYDVQIVRDSYVPPNFMTEEKWGCVIIDEDPTGTYAVGQEVCPGIVPPHDDCAGMSEAECLLIGMGNAIGFIYDQVAFAYEQYKVYIAQGISMIIPGCDSEPACKSWVKKGVDYGASYVTGLPATMPKSEELIGDSVAYYIVNGATEAEKYYTGSDVSAIETFCSLADCEEEISKYVQTELKIQRSLVSQPACIHGYEAYFHGQQPVCLDPSIIVHPAQGAYNYPGSVMVMITRKTSPESLAVKETDIGNYALDVSVQGTNTYNGDALDAPLYETARIALPWLKPGESTYIIAPLNPCRNANASGCSGGVNYYGFEGLYIGGTSHMKAVEACFSSGSSVEWVPCLAGGMDTWEFTNPATKTELP